MPTQSFAFTTKYNHLSLVLKNQSLIAPAFKPKTIPLQFSVEELNAVKFEAIWDTGATGTAISQNVVDKCNLKFVTFQKVDHGGGEELCEVYLICILLPNRLIFPSVRAVKLNLKDTDVIIGMDIISKGDFAVTNKVDKTVFSFRIPSLECIDFLEQKKEGDEVPATRPNTPCPCGSGVRYKHCHGKIK